MENDYKLVRGRLVPNTIVEVSKHLGPMIIAWYECLGLDETKKMAIEKFGPSNVYVQSMLAQN